MYHSVWPCQLANFITAQPKLNSTYWHLSVCNSHKVVVSIQHYAKMVFVLFPNKNILVGNTHSLNYILVNLWVVCICNSIVFLFRFILLRFWAVLCPCKGGDGRLVLMWNSELAAIHPKSPFIYQFLRHGRRLICFPKLFKAARAWQRTGSSVHE